MVHSSIIDVVVPGMGFLAYVDMYAHTSDGDLVLDSKRHMTSEPRSLGQILY